MSAANLAIINDPLPKVPAYIKQQPNWLCWNLEPDEKGRPTKVPYRIDGVGKASSDNPDTWAPYSATKNVEISKTRGLGIVPKGDLIGFDIDGCRNPETGEVTEWAESIIGTLHSYTEITPSQTGLRVWVRGQRPKTETKTVFNLDPETAGIEGRNPDHTVEIRVFAGKGYCTVTGDAFFETPVDVERRDLTEVFDLIRGIQKQYPLKKKNSEKNAEDKIEGKSVQIKQGTRPTDKLSLLTSGTVESRVPFLIKDEHDNSLTYPSWSEASMALATCLAMKHGDDAEKISGDYRQSSLYLFDTKKAERTLELTISKAIESVDDGTTLIGGDQFPTPIKVNRTELGNAVRFAKQCVETTRYCYEKKTWFIFDGKAWIEDDGSGVAKIMKSIAKSIVEEAAQIKNDKKRDAQRTWGLRSESRSTMSNALFLAQSEEGIPIKLERFDDDSTDFKFNTTSLTLDLENNKTYAPRKADFITKTSRVAYEPNVTCPRFTAFLDEVLPDPEVRAYIQRAAGLSLTGFTGEHAMFILYGVGRNGKSTLVDILRHVLGEYAIQSDWSTFTESKNGDGGGSGANNNIARLRGSRFVSASESSANARLAEGVIKNVTGGEPVQARFLFQDFFEFTPKFKLWVTTNYKPRIIGTDPAIWARVNLINFNVQIPREKRDKHLSKKLRAEAPGILNWMLKGYQEWEKLGLNPPDAVKAATEEYRQESDTLSRFIEEKCDLGEGVEVSASDIYNSYRLWISEAGEHYVLTIKQFKDALSTRGPVYKRTMDARKWLGIGLKRNTLPNKPAGSPPGGGGMFCDDEPLEF